MDRLIFFKADFLDEALHTGIDGGNVLLHLGIVGIFHTSQVNETGTNVNQSAQEETDNEDIVYQFLYFSCDHCSIY